MDKENKIYNIFILKHQKNRPLWRPKCKWKHIKTFLIEVECESMNWVELVQNRFQYRRTFGMKVRTGYKGLWIGSNGRISLT
jgi:hypothetical protein